LQDPISLPIFQEYFLVMFLKCSSYSFYYYYNISPTFCCRHRFKEGEKKRKYYE